MNFKLQIKTKVLQFRVFILSHLPGVHSTRLAEALAKRATWEVAGTDSSQVMLRIRNSRRGFTIIELILYMGMLSILLAVLSQIFVSILNVQLESQSSSSIEQDSRYI